MYLASPHETGPLAERISIDHYVAAFSNPNMRMHVMSRDPVMLEDALNYSIRYEALMLGSTEQAPHTVQPVVLDPASYGYDDKGRKKKSIRAAEIHQDKQREFEKSLEAQKALNDVNQRRILNQQRQLDSWRVWNDEQILLPILVHNQQVVQVVSRPILLHNTTSRSLFSTTGGSQVKQAVAFHKVKLVVIHPRTAVNRDVGVELTTHVTGKVKQIIPRG